jgi:hypothetical protein
MKLTAHELALIIDTLNHSLMTIKLEWSIYLQVKGEGKGFDCRHYGENECRDYHRQSRIHN